MFKSLFLGLIRFYQLAISPLIPPRCRYVPTCSQYAIEAIGKYGVCKGGYLATKRICRWGKWLRPSSVTLGIYYGF